VKQPLNMKLHNLNSFKILYILPVIALLFACNCGQKQLTDEQVSAVKNSVAKLTVNISSDVSVKGPIAWLNYFENSPDFFMASEGQIVFHSYSSAQKFIQDTLVKNISKIKLQWGNVHINVLSAKAASIGSDFHEDIIMTAGNKLIPVDGYFTGIAVLSNNTWKLRNLHWSIKTH
jgi:uncharacterized cupredoxin-like copper-binding protein